MEITWKDVDKLKRFAEGTELILYPEDVRYRNNCSDDYEQSIIDEATAQIRAHREKKFKTALARYVAEQGDSHETD